MSDSWKDWTEDFIANSNDSVESAEEKLRTWFLNLLMQRTYTEREARKRIEVKCHDLSIIETLTNEAKVLGLLDDTHYASLFAAGHESWGKDRISWELRRRGLEQEHIDDALQDIDETARAKELVESLLASGVEVRKIEARLRRRGFSGRVIRAALPCS